MLLSSLAAQLITRELATPAQGWAWAWRIQNEYSAPLREAAEAWAENKPLPNPQGGGHALDEVMKVTGASAPQALELLYVLEHSPADGLTLLSRCARRDRLR